MQVLLGMRQIKWPDLDAVCGQPPGHEWLSPQRRDQRRLTDIPFTDQKDLRLVLRLCVLQAPEVSRQDERAMLKQLQDRSLEGITVEAKTNPSLQELRELPGHRVEPIAPEIQLRQACHLTHSGEYLS
jgi:hypothetical protein